jgi:hypothetical protein
MLWIGDAEPDAVPAGAAVHVIAAHRPTSP